MNKSKNLQETHDCTHVTCLLFILPLVKNRKLRPISSLCLQCELCACAGPTRQMPAWWVTRTSWPARTSSCLTTRLSSTSSAAAARVSRATTTVTRRRLFVCRMLSTVPALYVLWRHVFVHQWRHFVSFCVWWGHILFDASFDFVIKHADYT